MTNCNPPTVLFVRNNLELPCSVEVSLLQEACHDQISADTGDCKKPDARAERDEEGHNRKLSRRPADVQYKANAL